MIEFEIRLAAPEDRNEIFNVHRDSVRNLCTGEYTSEQIEMWLYGRDPDMYLPAIERGEHWIAYRQGVILGLVEVEGSEITKLFVCGSAAGLGVGKALMNTAITHIRMKGASRIYLESTVTAQGFYRGLGFVQTGTGIFTRGDASVSLEIVKMELN